MQSKSIQQLNITYHASQDRLLLRAGMQDGQEIPVWISYRIARQLFRTLNTEARLPTAAAGQAAAPAATSPAVAVQQFAEEAEAVAALASMDFSSQYQTRNSAVGEQPLLIVNVQFVSVNHQLNQLSLFGASGVNLSINLNREIVLAVARLLQIACQDAQWPLQSEVSGATSPVMAAHTDIKQVLH